MLLISIFVDIIFQIGRPPDNILHSYFISENPLQGLNDNLASHNDNPDISEQNTGGEVITETIQ